MTVLRIRRRPDRGTTEPVSGWGFWPVRARIEYQSWSPTEARHFAIHWTVAVAGFCIIGTILLRRTTPMRLSPAGRYVFAPLPIVGLAVASDCPETGRRAGRAGFIVSRPKSREFQTGYASRRVHRQRQGRPRARWREGQRHHARHHPRLHTRPDDLVCDPCAGAATTLLAAVSEGRRAIRVRDGSGHVRKGRQAPTARPYAAAFHG